MKIVLTFRPSKKNPRIVLEDYVKLTKGEVSDDAPDKINRSKEWKGRSRWRSISEKNLTQLYGEMWRWRKMVQRASQSYA